MTPAQIPPGPSTTKLRGGRHRVLSVGLSLITGVIGVVGAAPPSSAHAAQQASTPLSAATPADPSLATQNAAHDHAMGSTIRAFEPAAAGSTARSAPSTSTLTAPAATAAMVPPGVPGLDVSGWQGTVDWGSVASKGAKFAYVKASEGGYVSNSSFAQQYDGSRNAGLIRGAYHYALPNKSSGTAQAQFFVAHGGGWTADGMTLPPLLDIEYDPYTGTDGTSGWCYGLSQTAMVTWIRDFSSTVASLTGRPPAIYTTTGWWKTCTGNSAAFGNNPLHIAAYPTDVTYGPGTLPSSWSRYTLWQFSDTGAFPGDQNVFNGTYSQLQSFAGTPATTPTPPPTPRPTIRSSADVLTIDSSGGLWGYPATGQRSLGSRYWVGSGWGRMKTAFVVDFNRDGIPDIVAQRDDGVLLLWLGQATGGFTVGVQIGTGWGGYQLAPSAWRTSDRFPGVVARDLQGRLWYYPNSVGSSLDGTRIALGGGAGWADVTINVMDVDGDGSKDVLANRTDGSLVLYRSDGRGNFVSEPRATVGSSWGSATSVVPVVGFDGAGSRGLLARAPGGALTYAAAADLNARQAIGSGWDGLVLLGSQDLVHLPSIRSGSDVVTLDPAGPLLRFPATFSGGLAPRVRIGEDYSRPVWAAAVDWDRDGVKDLLTKTPAGQLVLQRGRPDGGFANPVVVGGSGWAGMSVSVGRWKTSDRYPSVIAVTPTGQLRYYANPAGGQLTGSGVAIGTGWSGIDVLLVDWDRDGATDILGKLPSGLLVLFPGDGNGGFARMRGTTVGSGWQGLDSVIVTSNFAGRGEQGLLGRQADGTLRYYPLAASPGWGSPMTVSTNLGGQLILR